MYGGKRPNGLDIKGYLKVLQSKKLITIGESLHASIARCGEAMRLVYESSDSQSFEFIKSIIAAQADAGAEFIEVNVDKFGEAGPQAAEDMMRKYVAMVSNYGKGTAVCIDSSSDRLLIAGLEAWYRTGGEKKPLINSIKPASCDKLLPLSAKMPFSFVALLMTSDTFDPVAQLLSQADEIFDKAIDADISPSDIYYDTCAFPLSIDMPMSPDEKGRTFAAFETIKAIKSDPKFDGVHFSLGVSNCARDLPARRIDVIKAYLVKAMEYGLDAAIIDVRRKWFATKPDPQLYEMVSAFAAIDGSPDKLMDAVNLMTKFCADSRGGASTGSK